METHTCIHCLPNSCIENILTSVQPDSRVGGDKPALLSAHVRTTIRLSGWRCISPRCRLESLVNPANFCRPLTILTEHNPEPLPAERQCDSTQGEAGLLQVRTRRRLLVPRRPFGLAIGGWAAAMAMRWSRGRGGVSQYNEFDIHFYRQTCRFRLWGNIKSNIGRQRREAERLRERAGDGNRVDLGTSVEP